LEYYHTCNLNFIAIKLFLSVFALASAAQLPQTQARKSQQELLTGDFFVVLGVNPTYDYVVVGGGTAGLAIAYRLAADRNLS
jgi:choline dehydrogenase